MPIPITMNIAGNILDLASFSFKIRSPNNVAKMMLVSLMADA